MPKEQKIKAYNEYFALWKECEKCEKELLDLPKSEAKKLGMKVDLLFTSEITKQVTQKFAQLKELEAKKLAARQRFLETDN